MRDPKRNPIPGDIVSRWGSTRTVTAIEQNSNGTTTRVIYDGNSCSIGAWRAWTKTEATVKHTAGQPNDNQQTSRGPMRDLFEEEISQAKIGTQHATTWKELKSEVKQYQYWRQGNPFQQHMSRIALFKIEKLLASVSLAN